MRNLIFTIFISFYTFGLINAQNSKINFFVQGEFGTSYISNIENSRIWTYSAGLGAKVPLVNKFSIISGLKYVKKGGSSTSNPNYDFEYVYTQVQIPLKIEFDVTSKLNANVGFFGGYILQKNFEYQVGTTRVSGTTIVNDPSYNTTNEFKNYDAGFSFGIGYKFTNKWSVSFNFNQSIVKIYDGSNKYQFVVTDVVSIGDIEIAEQIKMAKNHHYSLGLTKYF